MKRISLYILLVALVIDASLWRQLFYIAHPGVVFLDVGQGDSELMVFKNGVKILTDAGPDGAVIQSLETALAPNDKYVDVGIITHE